MNTFISRKVIGVLALLCSTASMAASVSVVPSDANPAVATGFSVTVHADAMPANVGPSLGLSFDTSKVSFVSAAPAAAGPFSTVGGGFLTVVNPGGTYPIELYATPAGSPSGSFDVFVINFQAIAPGLANIQILENTPALGDLATFAWFDDVNFLPIQGIVYNQADVCVGGQCGVVPVPAGLWLLVSGLGSLVGVRRFMAKR